MRSTMSEPEMIAAKMAAYTRNSYTYFIVPLGYHRRERNQEA
jgi:hypothetical protein